MKLVITDANDFETHAAPELVRDVEQVLAAMPLHVKLSDQANHTDRLIFSPVGANAYIGEQLRARGWAENSSCYHSHKGEAV